MAKTFLILIFIFCASFYVKSQAVLSPILQEKINLHYNADEYVDIIIYFNNYKDISNLSSQLDMKKANFHTRVVEVNNLLKDNSLYSQSLFNPVITSILYKDINAISMYNYYWALNCININIKSSYVYSLSEYNFIRYIDLNTERYHLIDAKQSTAIPSASKDVNRSEWGLLAINAHKLWALGYTGRNVLLLSVDTGVGDKHPAIKNNFAGNNYPLSQCWYAVRNPEPVDNANSSHGTHTTGTALGLDRQTNDTIGVAFNAKWIACDPVASTQSELLTPVNLISVYQWALNPDGDTSTSEDVPRVINNSWGYDYDMASHFNGCELPEAEVLQNLEIAGICSPFSAGNEGPGVSTTGFPAMIAYNLVNPMAIGAVNWQNVIADFSSRGPTSCVDTEGSLKIKPEIVAPGESVRSCIGESEYGTYQGTSMACPHVSGALLLLAEAFPQASAYDLKYAIYKSAKDLGDVGEDNVYGNGMIDVKAAFDSLAIIYTPHQPITNLYDIETNIITPTNNLFCINSEERLPLKIEVKNTGVESMQNINLKVYLNKQLVVDTTAVQTFLANESLLFEYELQNIPESKNEIYVIAKPIAEVQEFDKFNNAKTLNFVNLYQTTFPYVAENITDLNNAKITVINEDRKQTWKTTKWGNDNEFNAMYMDFYSYVKRLKQIDLAILPKIRIPNEDSIFFSFNYAYKTKANYIFKDTLLVGIATDSNDLLKLDTVFYKGAMGLATVSGNASSAAYKPKTQNEFDTIKISLQNYKNKDIVIVFKAINDFGSPLYVDKISVQKIDNDNVKIDKAENKLSLYPNPSSETIIINNKYLQNETFNIYDITGKLVFSKILEKGENIINLKNLNKGMYFVVFTNSKQREKLIIY